ncbi:MAG TPA: TauD/TfdA family dioxygenase [Burkholderiales bacterium]|jgi:taurine dioxygenase|nr:TauD/TfdA family dioxygenase [Burkholderiales bacterium]
MQITPSRNVIGAEITDVDLGQSLSAAEFGRIEDAFNRHSVVCFPQQQLDEPQLVAFARRFGEVEKIFLTHYAHPKYPEIMFVSNIKKDGRDIGHADAGSVWHTDMSYTARPPRATLLYALEVPMENGVALGDTQFSSAADAYDSLSDAMKQKIAGLRAIHQVAGRRARTGTGQQDQALRREQPAVVHPVARTHPYTGRKCLYVSKGECEGIEGMSTDEALKLIDELAERTVEPRFRHTHHWRVRDVLMWDNCAVQHLASFDYKWPQHRRLMHRVTVGGSAPA